MAANIYLPGIGLTDLSSRRVSVAVEEYDERLRFRQNPNTGFWTIYRIGARNEPDLPILAFPQGVPHPEDALKELYKRDAVRRGDEIIDELNKRNADIKKQYDDASSKAADLVAEAVESYSAHNGLTRYSRSLSKETESRRTGGK